MATFIEQVQALEDIRHTCELGGKLQSWSLLYLQIWTAYNAAVIANTTTTPEEDYFVANRVIIQNNNASNFSLLIGGTTYTLTAGASYAMTQGEYNLLVNQYTQQGFASIVKDNLAEYQATGVSTVFGIG